VIQAIVGDLASVVADAVVRPTTSTLTPASPTLNNLERVAGPTFHTQLTTGRALGIGSAVVTDSGNLATDFVIHAVVGHPRAPIAAEAVRRAVQSALERADAWQFRRVAFPPIGVGPGNLVMSATAQIMAEVIIEHLKAAEYPSDVLIVVETENDREIFEGLFRNAS
jgi:O-acetyl-ADP-ribose deacetylase (regulator of RNase III)